MNDPIPHLPWPTPDPRARHWASTYADMHTIVEDLVIPGGAPPAAVSVMTTARELIRHSYYRHEFTNVAVAVSIISLEAALVDRYGKKALVRLIDEAAAEGLIDEEQRDLLHTGREIRNRFAHGKTTGAALTPPMAVGMVQTSLRILMVLSDPPAPAVEHTPPGPAAAALGVVDSP
ncbi:DUF4145 domain-containing protein [Streptomyces sp. Wb2n-11]|uniref:DUF4145 domain-containing protein n=1 Tax=Streptomyces sp. Wb2n-11 TaxID=1030533 RepID=UPI000ADD0A9B|nr:DUF4145 domain-containing protein [Streptomyces sp. Wb2n-11]